MDSPLKLVLNYSMPALLIALGVGLIVLNVAMCVSILSNPEGAASVFDGRSNWLTLMLYRSVVSQRTYLYVRVSTEDQAREGVSLAAQEERLRAFAVATGRENVQVILDDGASAKTLERPGLQQVLEAVRKGRAASVVVLKLDRLTRSVRDLADLVDLFTRTGTGLVSVTESLDTSTASGRLMMNLLASVSQWEREAIGERTSFALSHKRRAGNVYGPVPFGYRREGDKLVRDDERYAVLKRIQAMRAAGMSQRKIVAWLNENGIPTAQGCGKWYLRSLQQVLNSKMAQENAAA